MSLGNLLCVLLRINGMRRRLSTFDVSGVVRLHVQLIVAAAISAGAGGNNMTGWGFPASDSIAWAFVVTAIVGVLMVCVYALILQIFRVQEYNALLDPILKKLSRRAG
jgi:putative peptidoglycan lipid II flippase